MTSFVTVAEAGELAAQAALLLSLPVSTWSGADPGTQEAALQLATTAIKARPCRWYGNESDLALQLATVVQALHVIDLQANGEAHARMQRQGIVEYGQGKQRLTFKGAQGTGSAGALTLCREAREILASLAIGTVNLG